MNLGPGTLQGNLTNNGTLAPGNSPGAIAVTGNYAQSPGAQMLMELAGTAPEDFDTLSISGSATLGGTLKISLLDNFLPSPIDSFPILTAAALLGHFDTITTDAGSFDVLYSPNSVTLTNFSPVPEPTAMLLLSAVPLLSRRRRR